MKINGSVARAKGRANSARFWMSPIDTRERSAIESASVRNKIYAGQAPEGVKLKKIIKARVKASFTLASISWTGLLPGV